MSILSFILNLFGKLPQTINPSEVTFDTSMPPNFDEWKKVMKDRGFDIFTNGEYNLNICGWRSPDPEFNMFNDYITVAYRKDNEWVFHCWEATTLPGRRYMIERLLNSEGAAILAEGQYSGVYGVRLHNGKYEALCQSYGAVKVYRDGNKDEAYDKLPAKLREGWYGINIHKPYQDVATSVGSNSAGCQVFKRIKDFNEFMGLVYKAKSIWGNKFTYTLIER